MEKLCVFWGFMGDLFIVCFVELVVFTAFWYVDAWTWIYWGCCFFFITGWWSDSFRSYGESDCEMVLVLTNIWHWIIPTYKWLSLQIISIHTLSFYLRPIPISLHLLIRTYSILNIPILNNDDQRLLHTFLHLQFIQIIKNPRWNPDINLVHLFISLNYK